MRSQTAIQGISLFDRLDSASFCASYSQMSAGASIGMRQALPAVVFWFVPLSPDTGQTNQSATTIGQHGVALARKNITAFIKQSGLQYHSPHMFRHTHNHYEPEHAKDIQNCETVGMYGIHASMEIADEFYSNQNDNDVRARIESPGRASGQQASRRAKAFSRVFGVEGARQLVVIQEAAFAFLQKRLRSMRARFPLEIR